MSTEITTAFIRQYTEGITHVAQQEMSRLRRAVRSESMKGEKQSYDYLGSVEMVQRVGRHADTPLLDTPHSRRWVFSKTYDRADMIDQPDKVRLLNDPTNEYSQAFARAAGRQIDRDILEAAFATSITGKDAAVPATFGLAPDGTNMVIAAGADPLTTAKLITAKELLDRQEVPEMGRYIVVPARQLANLLRESGAGVPTVASSDFNIVKALVRGEINTWLGFEFIRTQLTLVDGAGDDRVLAYQRDGMLHAMGYEPRGSIDRRPDKNNDIQVHYSMDSGATRLQETHVVEIKCNPA